MTGVSGRVIVIGVAALLSSLLVEADSSNNVAPGFIATPLTTSPAAIQYLRAATTREKTPMARAGLPEEIADVVVFLSSPEASFVNGATWTVDGGYLSL